VTARVSDGVSNAIGWRTNLTAVPLAFTNVSALNGTMTIICPYAATFTNPTVTVVSGTGTCSAVTCPKLTLAAKEGVDCTFTCSATVLSVRANVNVSPTGDVLFPFTGVINATRVTQNDTATKCVWLSDPLFLGLNPMNPSGQWSTISVCADAATSPPFVLAWNSSVPAPDAGTQCTAVGGNYTVTNIAYAVTGDGSNVTLNSSSAVATVPCPTVSFALTGSTNRTINFRWCVGVFVGRAGKGRSGQLKAAGAGCEGENRQQAFWPACRGLVVHQHRAAAPS
jgi:hypothetical protein